jgi:hypothetical protein
MHTPPELPGTFDAKTGLPDAKKTAAIIKTTEAAREGFASPLKKTEESTADTDAAE